MEAASKQERATIQLLQKFHLQQLTTTKQRLETTQQVKLREPQQNSSESVSLQVIVEFPRQTRNINIWAGRVSFTKAKVVPQKENGAKESFKEGMVL